MDTQGTSKQDELYVSALLQHCLTKNDIFLVFQIACVPLQKMSRTINKMLSQYTTFWRIKTNQMPLIILLYLSELVIGEKRNNNKKLYTVLSYLGVFTFCTCKISNLFRVYCW